MIKAVFKKIYNKILVLSVIGSSMWLHVLFAVLISNVMVNAQNERGVRENISKADKPNIVLIMTDQHQAQALSCMGNLDVSTPNLDKLARQGIRFNNSYVTFPLCAPSRTSIFTGKLPHELGVNSNDDVKKDRSKMDNQNYLGNVLSNAGYDCVYGGKWHAPEVEMSDGYGFNKIAEFNDIPLAEKCINYLKSRNNRKQPFFLVASFDNPHNICEWARNQPLPYGNVHSVSLEKTPLLPVNFKKSKTFPEALQIEQSANQLVYPTQHYTTADWRQYRYAYYRLIEKVDHEIGKIINAIDSLGLRKNTLILFTSDHGDGNASHGWNQKTALFQESVKVPLIASMEGTIHHGQVNNALVCNGLDLYPTILDFANIRVPNELTGKSLRSIFESKEHQIKRDFIVIETKFDGKQAFGSTGRALISGKFKYVVYSWGKNREQFFDLEKDPNELNNLIASKLYINVIDEFRLKLINWCRQTNDHMFLRRLVLPSNSTTKSSELFNKPY